MRLFVGLPLDEEAKRGVKKVVKKLKRGHWPVRWEEAEKWHVTVAFSAKQNLVEPIIEAVRHGVVGIKPFVVEFKGLGSWPDLFLPRGIWMCLKGDLKSMARLYKQVRVELEKSLPPEADKRDKPFRPHVSIARVERQARRKQRLELGKVINKQREMEIKHQWLVDRVRIYESQLKPEGSVYRVVKEVKLSV